MGKKKTSIPLYWALVGTIIFLYNQVVDFIYSFGFDKVWQANFIILVVIIFLTYQFTPYIDAIVKGIR